MLCAIKATNRQGLWSRNSSYVSHEQGLANMIRQRYEHELHIIQITTTYAPESNMVAHPH